MPPTPHYELFPWVVTTGKPTPLKLHTVINDRHFMESNELNLLDTLMLLEATDEAYM